MSDTKFDGWDDEDAVVGTVNAEPGRGPFDDVRTLENVAVESDFNDASSPQLSPRTAEGSKPNYAVVGAAGAIGLLVLAGVGLFIKGQFFPSKSNERTQDRMVLAQPAPAVAPATGAASVFEQPAGPSVSVIADATSQPKQAPAVESPAAPALSLAAAAPVLTTAPPSPAAAPVAVPLAAVVCENDKPAKAVQVARAEPKKQAPAVAKRKAPAVAKAKTEAALGTAQEPAAQAKAGQETIVLPEGLKVHAIYPLSGHDTQAWIRESSGRTTIVRVGEFLAGAQVTKILAEKGEVFTTAGVLTTYGQR